MQLFFYHLCPALQMDKLRWYTRVKHINLASTSPSVAPRAPFAVQVVQRLFYKTLRLTNHKPSLNLSHLFGAWLTILNADWVNLKISEWTNQNPERTARPLFHQHHY